MNRIVLSAFFLAFTLFNLSANNNILIEAESFSNKGGWVVDQQFMDVMGSPYLLAHGLGEPVENAETSFSANSEGSYHYWVRTKDWAPYPKGPGKFQIIINNKTSKTFGSNGDKEWKW